MSKHLFVLVLFVSIACSSEKKETFKSNEKIKSSNELAEDTIQEVINKGDVYSWLNDNFNIEVANIQKKKVRFDQGNYLSQLPKKILKDLSDEFWLKDVKYAGIEEFEDGLVIDVSGDDNSKLIILTKDYFTVSYHYIVGSDGRTYIYDFKKKKSIIDTEIFAIRPLSSFELLVGKDYYDTRDVEDPEFEGHIFEKGTYNLKTNKYTFLEKE